MIILAIATKIVSTILIVIWWQDNVTLAEKTTLKRIDQMVSIARKTTNVHPVFVPTIYAHPESRLAPL